MYFSFDFGWYSIHFDIVHQEQGDRVFFLLNGQNLLSVTKVICLQSLIHIAIYQSFYCIYIYMSTFVLYIIFITKDRKSHYV